MDNNMNNELEQPVVQIVNEKKESKIIYVTSLLYVCSIYLVPVVSSVLSSMELDFAYHLFWLPVIIGIANFVVSIKCCRPGNRIVLLNAAVLIKYALIPFFILNGLLSLFLLFCTIIPHPIFIFVGPVGFLALSVLGWFVMVLGAPVTISYLCVSAKEKQRHKGMVIIHSLLQFFLVFDVIDVMVLTLKERRWKKLTITIIILLAAFALLIVLLLVLGIIGVANK